MYNELNLYNLDPDLVLCDAIYFALENQIDGIVVSHTEVSEARQYISDTLILSCMIDYPFGLSDTKVRQHSCLLALKKGANSIDLVLSKLNRYDKIKQELVAINHMCLDNNAVLRIIIDYRLLSDEEILKFAKIVNDCDIEYMIPSTGQFVDDYINNVMAGLIISDKYNNIKVITNGNIWQSKQYDTIAKSGIFGVRLNSLNNLSFITMGV